MESTISDSHEDNFINPNCGLNSSNSMNDNVSNITSNLEKKIKCQIFKQNPSPLYFRQESVWIYDVIRLSSKRNIIVDYNNLKLSAKQIIFLRDCINTIHLKEKSNIQNLIPASKEMKERIEQMDNISPNKTPIMQYIESLFKTHNQNFSLSIRKITELVNNHFNINLSKTTIHRIMRNKLHYKYVKTSIDD